jgi:hypothetical protein
MSSKKYFFVLAGVVFLTLIMFIPMTQAQEPVDMVLCGDATLTTIVATPELTIMRYEDRGISLDNLASKVNDNCTYQTVGVLKIERGKMTGTLYQKLLHPNGDFVVIEGSQVGMTECDYKLIYGTGQWKGVTGGGKVFSFMKGMPISPGTSQACTKVKGAYEIKK